MTLSGIGELPLFKRRGSNVEELEALLDLLPNATLIADGRNGRILFSNAQVTQLTAYTRRELAELEIGTLLPGFPTSALQNNGNTETARTLVTRSSRSIQVWPKTEILGGPDHWVAFSFRDLATETINLAEVNRQRWEAMHMLSLALQQEDIHSCYRQILQAGRQLLEADQIALYVPLPDGGMNLESVIGSGVDFPIQLTQGDLSHLRTPKVWMAGKPLESSLHRLANTNKTSYLATCPIDLTNPDTGLVVIAESVKQAPKEILALVQILAATAGTAQMNAMVLENARKQFRALNGSDQIRSVLQENVQDGVLFIDNKLSIIDINPAAETMLGYTSSEAKGRSANEILVSSQSLQPALEQTWLESRPTNIGQRKILRRDGTEFLASIRLVPVNNGGAIDKVAVLITDLSEHEAFHIQTQQLQQRAAIGEITAIFAHEVRNPINSISTGLQLMQMNIPEHDPLQEQIKKLQEDVDRLEHRMKSVDTFSRNLEPHPEPLDLADFCRSQLDRWRPRMNRKHITDHLQAAPDIPAILGDRRALDQVFTNLITNAIQAMEDQSEGVLAIRVRTNEDDPSLVDLYVSDSGPGIPEDIRKRIFEPFFTTKGQEGTGLGLAITRRIIMAHNGKIECESFPGGTLFKIQLPVAPAKTEEGTPV